MKRHYIEAVGDDGKKVYASGRCGFLHDFTYAKFFKTIDEAERYMAWRKPHLPCEIKCKEQRVKNGLRPRWNKKRQWMEKLATSSTDLVWVRESILCLMILR